MRRRQSNHRNRGIPSSCEGIGIKPKACGNSTVISQSACMCGSVCACLLNQCGDCKHSCVYNLIPWVLFTDVQWVLFVLRLCFTWKYTLVHEKQKILSMDKCHLMKLCHIYGRVFKYIKTILNLPKMLVWIFKKNTKQWLQFLFFLITVPFCLFDFFAGWNWCLSHRQRPHVLRASA